MFALFLILLLLPAPTRGYCVDGEREISRDPVSRDPICEVCPEGESSISGDKECYKVEEKYRTCSEGWYGEGWCVMCPSGTTSSPGAVKIQDCIEPTTTEPDPGTDPSTDPGCDRGFGIESSTGNPRPALGNLVHNPRAQTTPVAEHYAPSQSTSTNTQLGLIITLLVLLVVVTLTAVTVSWRRATTKTKQNLISDDFPSHSMSTERYYQLSHVPSDISSNVFESEAPSRFDVVSRLGSEVYSSRRGTYDITMEEDQVFERSDSSETLCETVCETLCDTPCEPRDIVSEIVNQQTREDEDYMLVNYGSLPDIKVEMYDSEEDEIDWSLQHQTLSTDSDLYEFCKNVINKTLGL